MVSISKRYTFQVGDAPADERTLTLSSASNEGYYISLRPFVQPSDAEKEFPFEWAFAGSPGTAKHTKLDELRENIDFDFEFDTNVHLEVANTHRGVIETKWKKWESGLVEERGQVFPFGPEKQGVSFFELWQPIDATRADFVPLGENSANQESARSVVLTLKDSNYKGLIVTVGSWTQGIIFKKDEHSVKGVSILRAVESEGKTKNLLQFGSDFDKFPTSYIAEKGALVQGANNSQWEVVESNV